MIKIEEPLVTENTAYSILWNVGTYVSEFKTYDIPNKMDLNRLAKKIERALKNKNVTLFKGQLWDTIEDAIKDIIVEEYEKVYDEYTFSIADEFALEVVGSIVSDFSQSLAERLDEVRNGDL